ncbi:MAG: glycosyltransferase [Deltaproteobacteria bacterium]|jgi:glycosyltransferase involved in cell wall biosynthesis/thioredoxin-like negative regulator of GroEL|nr:glycosyltransferase [Deltaproteobacteria bacterium]
MAALDHPKVTALISTFNRPQYLAESISSITAQTMGDWELIVLNDGGVDVGHVVEKFADPRIIYVPDTANKGAAIRFNQGLKMAKGDYICYLGDDDTFYPNHFEVLSKALDENPEAGLAYSDLYAVSSVSDAKTGRRHILDKQMLVSRDFNREFMFHYNHVLHVSLMHRREAALRVGGFDEEVKVLIEWSLNRRLAFIYDFIHVEVPTGEYHMAVFKSDRISVRERRNQESYKHNLRRIRCNLPAAPWAKVETLDLLYLVDRWGDKLNTHIKEIIDNFDHPMRIKLIGNGAGLSESQAWDSLKELRDLKNIEIVHIPQKLPPVIAFRKAAKESRAKFLFLVTPALQAVKAPRRLFSTLEILKGNSEMQSIRWAVEGEEKEKTVFECLIYREYFLKNTKPRGNKVINVPSITLVPPKGFKFDIMYGECQKLAKANEHNKAFDLLEKILSEKQGFPHIQFLINDLFPLCLARGDYERAEKELYGLIERGYTTDNYFRLAQLRWAQKRYSEVIEAGNSALESLNLKAEDLEADCFPFKLGKELNSFILLMSMGEAFLEIGAFDQAARHFHMASKLKSDSHKPFLGFAKTYLAAGQLDRAEQALLRLPQPAGLNDPATHRLLATLCRKRKNLPLAFDCLLKAFEKGPKDELNVEPFYFTGAGLGKWREMVEPLKTFVLHNENHSGALGRLASIHFNLGEDYLAKEAALKANELDPNNPVAKSILDRIAAKEAKENQHQAPSISEGENGLTLDLNSDILPGLMDNSPIAW